MQLCQSRPEGLSTSSNISYPLPTQCLFDAVLVPLPTWILMALLAVFALIFRTSLAGPRRASPRCWARTAALVIYYFSIGVVILMETVEIARLARAGLGIGLLAFVYVGCLAAIAAQATDGGKRALAGWQLASLVFWALGLCITSAKHAALGKFGTSGRFARVGSAYPVADQLTDLMVLLISYALLVGVEVALWFLGA